MLWIKALHIIFVTSWFAGLFYLPRIFVNLAQETPGPTTERLLLMSRKLYRFTTMLAVAALVFGLVLTWMQYHSPDGMKLPGWLHAKLTFVLLVLGYHHACGSLLKKFERGVNKRGHVFYRWFNEVPVLLLVAIVILVVVKPF
ncbi:CopD family protein [Pseudoduganella umbonata]|uniref:Protoporphyrinogen IX oxidase n=1 Tax=Pseudoduganella umbonata TaxID=864828 RepID=A0A4P8HU80_9BURK|nr:CopD family protein [Pseudoduganella umbonata]MBB3220362.1 putative membrane protein [Pseudoduganella umbonata]QCP12100.1 CopD family protein [Pseudoduganella umbonata]